MLGFNNSLVTLLSQAYGAQKFKYLGDTVNRARIFFGLCFIPIFIILYFTDSILLAIGQEEEVAHEAGKFVKISMLGFFFHLQYDIYRKFLNSIRKSKTYVWFPYVTFAFSAFLGWLLIASLDLKTVGGALIGLFNPMLNLSLCMLVVNYYKIGTSYLKWPDKESLKFWCELFMMGLPTYLLQVFACISAEIVLLMTGYISTSILVANTALVNIYYMIGILGLSLQVVASALIGNKVGERDIEGTRNMIKATTIVGGVLILISQIMFYLASLSFTSQETKTIYPIISLTLAIYLLNQLLVTILIGLGLQSKTVAANIMSYLLFGIPLSYYLTFHIKWIYYGPWIGLMLATLFNSCYFYRILLKNDMRDLMFNSRKKYNNV